MLNDELEESNKLVTLSPIRDFKKKNPFPDIDNRIKVFSYIDLDKLECNFKEIYDI